MTVNRTNDMTQPPKFMQQSFKIINEGNHMKINQSQIHGNKLVLEVLNFLIFIVLCGYASIAGATYSLPADRSVVWQGNVGVKGDIPTRTVIYKTLNPSGGDDTAAINAALTACPAGQVVQLGAGTFTVSSAITVKSNTTLRGAGMGVTTIKGAAGLGSGYIVGISGGSSFGTSLSITAGMTKGSTTITTSAAHGWSVGDIILIDQLNDAAGDPVVTNIGTNGTCTWCGRTSGTRSWGR